MQNAENLTLILCIQYTDDNGKRPTKFTQSVGIIHPSVSHSCAVKEIGFYMIFNIKQDVHVKRNCIYSCMFVKPPNKQNSSHLNSTRYIFSPSTSGSVQHLNIIPNSNINIMKVEVCEYVYLEKGIYLLFFVSVGVAAAIITPVVVVDFNLQLLSKYDILREKKKNELKK
ncbi:hypothetical protein FF38_14531 [Lucilia cuprina]|uniref:Uncharacterized protein n=1 Tax=Lucilia cuprina TaxID=7375 RepID=A0A0L0CA30_LUCCU|nr:hypothetical protein FF38_14531 [Lucilia cuprina]